MILLKNMLILKCKKDIDVKTKSKINFLKYFAEKWRNLNFIREGNLTNF